MTRIVISSGHSKFVSGAVGVINEVREARRVTDRVAANLRSVGVHANVFHDDKSRSQNANLTAIVAHHNRQNRDLDVSVHFNAFKPSDGPRGVEVLYRTNAMKTLADKVSRAIAEASGLINRGAKHRTNLSFLNRTAKPAILLEICFVDSKEDVRLYRLHFDEICRVIAQAISGKTIPPLVGEV